MTNYVNCKNSEGSGNYRKLLKSEQKNILLIFMGFTENNKGTRGNDSNLLIVFYVQIMPDDFVMQLHRF
ncbi:putative carnitine operon oxidoreductase [Escherichia coli]|uniref:Putative carnitine operon oxidoreductase n=1 Tax=Escherichia coli TaxID=562 RepID=A0A377C498_ECOLX|nr:putative carnitine operon oxidoreductase [Escherichia coli]